MQRMFERKAGRSELGIVPSEKSQLETSSQDKHLHFVQNGKSRGRKKGGRTIEDKVYVKANTDPRFNDGLY